jgi:putative hydrolase of the HAD superfamily
MNAPLTTILFDMDNTLFDLVDAQIAACHAVAEYLGRDDGNSLFEDYFMSDLRGFESHENIRDYLKGHSLPEEGSYREACRIYERVKLETINPYERVYDTLADLQQQGYLMGIITDAHSRDAMLRMEKTGLLRFFSGIVLYDMVLVKNPHMNRFSLPLT